MVKKVGKLWVVDLGGREEVCVTREVAQKLLDQYNAAHATKPQVYQSFEDAMEDHGEDEDDLAEEE
jgi:hypothetical protein